MSDVMRRAAEIQAAREAAFEAQKYVMQAHDTARYQLPGLAQAAAERDGPAALACLERCKAELSLIASGKGGAG